MTLHIKMLYLSTTLIWYSQLELETSTKVKPEVSWTLFFCTSDVDTNFEIGIISTRKYIEN